MNRIRVPFRETRFDKRLVNYRRLYDTYDKEKLTIEIEVPDGFIYNYPQYKWECVSYFDYKKQLEGYNLTHKDYDAKTKTILVHLPPYIPFKKTEMT